MINFPNPLYIYYNCSNCTKCSADITGLVEHILERVLKKWRRNVKKKKKYDPFNIHLIIWMRMYKYD